MNGIICAVALLTVSGLNALKDRKIEISGQAAVVGADNSLYGQSQILVFIDYNSGNHMTKRNLLHNQLVR